MNVSSLHCDTDGCFAVAWWMVAKDGRTRNVCSSCRDEMLALYGWTLFVPEVMA